MLLDLSQDCCALSRVAFHFSGEVGCSNNSCLLMKHFSQDYPGRFQSTEKFLKLYNNSFQTKDTQVFSVNVGLFTRVSEMFFVKSL